MNTPLVERSGGMPKSGYEAVAPDLSLSETLRVMEVARGMRQRRAEAEVALARSEIREVMRKRLMDAATITGDKITEADVDAAIDQYFATQYAYSEPKLSFPIFLAHLYIRRLLLTIILGTAILICLIWKSVF